MTMSGAAIVGMLLLTNVNNIRLSNKIDNLNAARQVVERIGKDVRMAKNIGDLFGNYDALYDYYTGSNLFPSPQDCLWGGGQSPTGGWPASPWPQYPYTLSPQCLIVQVPVFDSATGYPTRIQTGQGNPAATGPQDNVDTYVYMVLPDSDVPGTFKLQVAGFPGNNSSMQMLANPPSTLLKGIVGPFNTSVDARGSTNPNPAYPCVFQYLDKTDPNGSPLHTGPDAGAANANLTGVLFQVEIRADQNSGINTSTVGVKTEVYMRNNALSTIQASP